MVGITHYSVVLELTDSNQGTHHLSFSIQESHDSKQVDLPWKNTILIIITGPSIGFLEKSVFIHGWKNIVISNSLSRH